jgi:hypothetical protein
VEELGLLENVDDMEAYHHEYDLNAATLRPPINDAELNILDTMFSEEQDNLCMCLLENVDDVEASHQKCGLNAATLMLTSNEAELNILDPVFFFLKSWTTCMWVT